MSREILFRGKTAQNEWVYGFYVKHGECDWIYTGDIDKLNAYDNHYGTAIHRPISHLLIPGTICQYTGLTDKNGSKIFEGDIVKDDSAQLKGAIKFSERYLQFIVNDVDNGEQDYSEFMKEVEIVGNIFDNPELLDRSTE